jgi:hypothetical protein
MNFKKPVFERSTNPAKTRVYTVARDRQLLEAETSLSLTQNEND